jgi:hypothetical protein
MPMPDVYARDSEAERERCIERDGIVNLPAPLKPSGAGRRSGSAKLHRTETPLAIGPKARSGGGRHGYEASPDVHDTLLIAFGSGAFLENEFRTLLGTAGLRKHVSQLTVITVQDLEHLESSVGPFSLREFLLDYTNESHGGVRSVHNYMAFSKYRETVKPSAALMKRATELLEHARRVLFPPETSVEQDHIQVRAYFIWEREGEQHGHDLDHWLRAVAEIIGEKSRLEGRRS